jgi:hypothetical protein
MRPTNLKDAHECGTCRWYSGPQEGRGVCKTPKFLNYSVGEDEVCDEWEAGHPEAQARYLWAKHRRRLREAS